MNTEHVTAGIAPAQQLDQQIHAALARASASLSIASPTLAALDWSMHLACSPGKCLELLELAITQSQQLARYLLDASAADDGAASAANPPPVTDRRFDAPEWQRWPFNLLHQSFLLNERWWNAATTGVWGVEKHHEDLMAFAMRQWLDIFSPGNQLLTNPVVLRATVEQHGDNLRRGLLNGIDSLGRQLTQRPPAGVDAFEPGRNLALTPGKVVLRNRLMELIQYAPATAQVCPEPVLLVPAWIMKYYILDLSAHNSLVRFLVERGHTVFCISWKNPGEAERDLGMDDYLESGFHAALDAIGQIVPGRSVHATGYCLGGTLLSIAAAAMARDGDQRLASMTLLAAQTDFAEPGELGLFIDESQVSLLEAQMAQAGTLSAGQMAGAFQMLRSYDLLWSQLVRQNLLGEAAPVNDLMAWNADATRMPARMHSEYLRRLFLNDDLSEGRYPVRGVPVSLNDIHLPTFIVGTVTDHVAPWRSVYKFHYLCPAEVTFVLTSGGHNAGIVSAPDNPRRQYQLQTRPAGGTYVPPDEWLASAPVTTGSWWLAWEAWLRQRSGVEGKPPRMGLRSAKPLCDAPGLYVKEK